MERIDRISSNPIAWHITPEITPQKNTSSELRNPITHVGIATTVFRGKRHVERKEGFRPNTAPQKRHFTLEKPAVSKPADLLAATLTRVRVLAQEGKVKDAERALESARGRKVFEVSPKLSGGRQAKENERAAWFLVYAEKAIENASQPNPPKQGPKEVEDSIKNQRGNQGGKKEFQRTDTTRKMVFKN